MLVEVTLVKVEENELVVVLAGAWDVEDEDDSCVSCLATRQGDPLPNRAAQEPSGRRAS